MGLILQKRLKQAKFAHPGQEAIINVMVAASFLRSRLDEYCGEFGLTAPQYNVLRILRGVYPNGHPRYEIISRMIDNAPDITRIIDGLSRRGLVERYRSPDDGRCSMARITKTGLDLVEKAAVRVTAFNKRYSRMLSNAEVLELSRLCEKIYGALD